jgi:cell division protein FtsB
MTTKQLTITMPKFIFDQYLNSTEIDNRSQFILQYFMKGLELTVSNVETAQNRNIQLTQEVQKLSAENNRLKRENYLLIARYRRNNEMTPNERKAEGILRRGLG